LSRTGRIVERLLAVLAALCLVGAFALAMLWPIMTTLDELLALTDQDLLVWLHDVVRAGLPDWIWRMLFQPMLSRPCWMLPLIMGVVLGGAALTAASRRGVPDTPRWRE
jgi:hypothetical protein